MTTVITRRTLLAASALALTGCGSRAAQESAADAPSTTTVTTRLGTAEIPRRPQRVTTTYDTSTDLAYVLGLPLAGIGSSVAAGGKLPEYQRNLGLDDLPRLSGYPEPDVEAFLTLNTDLVLDDYALTPETGAKLAAAVAVYTPVEDPDASTDWRQPLRTIAALFGASTKAEQVIATYDERAAALRARVAAKWSGATFAYVGPYEDGTYYVAQADMMTNEVLHTDLGLGFAKSVPPDVESRKINVSMERIGELADADLLLLRTNPNAKGTARNDEQVRQFEQNSLWRRLPAVRDHHAYLIPGALFYSSPLTAAANLDWVEQNLL